MVDAVVPVVEKTVLNARKSLKLLSKFTTTTSVAATVI